MYDTGGSHSVCWPAAKDVHIAQRLSCLKHETDPEAQRRRLALEKEERRALSMERPLTTEEAYRWFGTFLGLLPPMALFNRAFLSADGGGLLWVGLVVMMNVCCCVAGRWYGGVLGRWAGRPGTRESLGFGAVVFCMALGWGFVTGGIGGAPFFGIGAVFGIICALPVALAAFPVFAILHRLLSHGGMIEARHTWPLAFGIPLTIAALIMSPWLIK